MAVGRENTVDVDLSKYPKILRWDSITICLKDCIRIPGSGAAKNVEEKYGATPMFSDTSSSSTSTTAIPQPTVHIVDHVCNMEAMVSTFLAEHFLSFSLAQPMIGMCREFSKDSLKISKDCSSQKIAYVQNHCKVCLA